MKTGRLFLSLLCLVLAICACQSDHFIDDQEAVKPFAEEEGWITASGGNDFEDDIPALQAEAKTATEAETKLMRSNTSTASLVDGYTRIWIENRSEYEIRYDNAHSKLYQIKAWNMPDSVKPHTRLTYRVDAPIRLSWEYHPYHTEDDSGVVAFMVPCDDGHTVRFKLALKVEGTVRRSTESTTGFKAWYYGLLQLTEGKDSKKTSVVSSRISETFIFDDRISVSLVKLYDPAWFKIDAVRDAADYSPDKENDALFCLVIDRVDKMEETLSAVYEPLSNTAVAMINHFDPRRTYEWSASSGSSEMVVDKGVRASASIEGFPSVDISVTAFDPTGKTKTLTATVQNPSMEKIEASWATQNLIIARVLGPVPGRTYEWSAWSQTGGNILSVIPEPDGHSVRINTAFSQYSVKITLAVGDSSGLVAVKKTTVNGTF